MHTLKDKIVGFLEQSHEPISIAKLYYEFKKDLAPIEFLKYILSDLNYNEKIISTKQGILLKREVIQNEHN